MKQDSLDQNKLRWETKRRFLSYIFLHHLLQKENFPLSVLCFVVCTHRDADIEHLVPGDAFQSTEDSRQESRIYSVFSRIHLGGYFIGDFKQGLKNWVCFDFNHCFDFSCARQMWNLHKKSGLAWILYEKNSGWF